MDQTSSSENRFNELAKRWREETGFHSNPHFIMDNDAFRGIVEMGDEALPHIFKRIANDQPGPWWMPLERITGVRLRDGVTPVERARGWVKTDAAALKLAWLGWGIQHKYISPTKPEIQGHTPNPE